MILQNKTADCQLEQQLIDGGKDKIVTAFLLVPNIGKKLSKRVHKSTGEY